MASIMRRFVSANRLCRIPFFKSIRYTPHSQFENSERSSITEGSANAILLVTIFFKKHLQKKNRKNEITHDSKAALSVHLQLYSEVTCYRNVIIENYTWARLDMESLFSCSTP